MGGGVARTSSVTKIMPNMEAKTPRKRSSRNCTKHTQGCLGFFLKPSVKRSDMTTASAPNAMLKLAPLEGAPPTSPSRLRTA